MGDYYIGLISGTSMDSIDAALVKFEEASVEITKTHEHRYPENLRDQLLLTIRDPEKFMVDDIGQLDRRVGESFRDAANKLIENAGIDATAVTAIGSHGQTIRHRPEALHPFTLQIGDPSVIATGTGIRTVADFRRADVALGGQGAPLTPLFHEWLFNKPGSNRVVLNIGGIANITIMPGDAVNTSGFDTGPGNTLLDTWVHRHLKQSFDKNGDWAAQGEVSADLLERLLTDPYFNADPPKSTGFEYFNLEWLEAADLSTCDPVDVQATLSALTANSIAAAIHQHAGDPSDVFVCGGGVHNSDLLQRLGVALPGISVTTTESVGLDPDWVEAVAFAWLAMRNLQGLPGNLPAVTGASRPAVLGATYSPV